MQVDPFGAPVKPRISRDKVQQLMVYLLRDERVFATARGQLDRVHFSGDPQWALAWEVRLQLAERFPGPCPPDAFYLELVDKITALGDSFPEEYVVDLLAVPSDGVTPGLAHYAFEGCDPKSLTTEYGLELLRDFLEERKVIDAMRRKVTEAGDDNPTDLAAFVAELYQEQAKIRSLGRSVVHSLLPDDFSPKALDVFPTGCTFLDDLMGGGQAGGEVYGFQAPYSGGKTTLGGQLVANAATYFLEVHKRQKLPLKHAYLFSYEEPPDLIRTRLLSYAADISKTELDYRIRSWDDFSRKGRLKDYERARYAARGMHDFATLNGEYERIKNLEHGVSLNVHIVDMTGMEHPDVGNGGAAEIAAFLANEAAAGRTPGFVMVDYCLAVVNRQCAALGLDPTRHLRLKIKELVWQSGKDVAGRFNVPVWILHQFNGEAQQRRVATPMQLSDSAEAKSFSENLWFSFLLGHADPETHVAQMHVGKARRAGTGGKLRMVQLDGEFARLNDADGKFVLDTVTNRIVSKEELHKLQGVAPMEPAEERRRADDPYRNKGKPNWVRGSADA